MNRLQEGIKTRLKHLLTLDKVQRVESLVREIEELARERLEVDQRVPLWDRIVFFSDTPDEGRAGEIDLTLEPRRRVLGQLRREIEADFDRVGRDFPPFGIGVAVERCFRVAREQLRVEGFLRRKVAEQDQLRDELAGLADRIVETWVRDFQPTRMFERISDPDRCEEVAGEPEELDEDVRLGVAPVLNRHLIPLVARRLKAGPFFGEKARLLSLQRERDRLEGQYRDARGSVSLLDRLNPFSDSRAERRRDDIKARLAETEESLRRCFETTRRLLHQALAAYPPLAIYQRVVEVLGVAQMLRVERERNLTPSGEATSREIVAPRALVFASLRRLLETFGEVFPDVPLPLQVTLELSDGNLGRRRSPREKLIREFHERLDASWAPGVRDQALEHAAMQGRLGRTLKRVRGNISLVDRIVFWSESVAKQRTERLEERDAWHREAAEALWSKLLGAARSVGETLAPLAARDLAIRASDELDAVHTEDGQASIPRACGVHGRERVLGSLVTMRRSLGEHYGLEGSRAVLLAAVAAQAEVAPPEQEPSPFEPLSYADVVERLAGRLQSTPFRALYETLQEPLAGRPPTVWDAVALGDEPEGLSAEVCGELRRIDELVERAFDAYPPARLFYGLGGVILRVESIRAVSREVQDSDPLRHACVLEGKGEAQAALRRWCTTLVETFGRLPDYHELLQLWELRGIQEPGWQFDTWDEG